MDILKSFGTDSKKETEGVWIDIGPDCSILVARAATRAYGRALTKEVEKYKVALGTKDDVADDTSDMIMCKVMAEHILLGWKGLSYDGAPLEYSKENAAKVLAIKDFRKVVMGHADDLANFKAQAEEATVKN